ncbi:putative helicase C15C4.05 [Psilocybe cubensis]|uniref:RNA helicase n=2 Tax=Psilocybe cubensis TaxID=181762 RepID=A0A8H8CPQ0_PSICU|nr:putative helicase C15C4.05 [Psilocybe cubensis]KAH9486800.1 putative helicase C15C4.05 [Psilocybe cubensis]
MAKKKKTQLKPVARGFTTTSLPKKVVSGDIAEVERPSIEASVNTFGEDDDGKITQRIEPVEKETSSIISSEEVDLQNLVDRHQDKTEREVSRTLKSIEVDRRYSQTLPRLDIDPLLRDKLLDISLNSEISEGQKTVEDSEEKTLSRLSISYGVLRRLGFTEERVDECLRSISGVELDEAFDWLYLHCSEEELPFESQISATFKLPSGVTFRKNVTPPPTPRIEQVPLYHSKPVVNQSPSSTGGVNISNSNSAENPDDLVVMDKPKTPPTDEYTTSSEGTGSDDEFDNDPTLAYVRLKLKLDEISSNPQSQLRQEQLKQLRDRLNKVAQDYLFDEKDAFLRYKEERNKIDQQLLNERLRLSGTDLSEPSKSRDKKPHTTKPSKGSNIVDDGNDTDDSIGMLGILEDPNATEINIKGVTFCLRDMTVPKHWSGPMPKTMLRDLVTKMDRYAAISYTTLSDHSRARRASVSISWQNKKRDEWIMDDVACSEDSQAEQYIAAVALHSLTHPLAEGFIPSIPANASSSTSFRLLPAVYRDLWDEMEISRKARDDAINRQIWSKLLSIMEDKIQRDSKVCQHLQKQQKTSSGKPLSGLIRNPLDNKDHFDSLSLAFQARQQTTAYQEMLSRRNDLPIARFRDRIVEILAYSQVLVLSGETGCGKSTQVPSFILEDHMSKGKPCKIYCTEPRRISAISLAQRVSYELCDPPNSVGTNNSLVGYSIRLESNICRNTRLAFVTNGIALRMLEGGSGQGGSGTAFDEITVHERTIESDFLLIVLKSLLIERPDLKVVLMSATLDAEKISSYFGNCEILQVPGRTFPVDVKYLEDAIECTKWSISDNSPYARRLHDKYYKGKNRSEWTEDAPTIDDEDDELSDSKNNTVKLEKRYSTETVATLNTIDERLIPYDLIIRLLEVICFENYVYRPFSPAILIFMPGLGEIRRLNDTLVEHAFFGSSEFRIYPLHSTLSSESQGAVFDVPPPGIRKIVIATNIAETGITIPDITCVIDTGKHREMRFDEKRQISRLVETFISRSNAAQRRGRAGRVQSGLCFHLFTRIRHETQMAESPLPEMMRLSLSDLALRIKIMKVKLGSSIEDVLARALDPPISINVQRAVSMLIEVRALTPSEEITPMGRLLSKLPTDVHLGKFLLISTLFRCLDPALTIAATLNSKSPFVAPFGLEHDADRARNSFRIENSDFLTIHNAFSSWRTSCADPNFARKFCRKYFLSHQNLLQIEDLRQQFLGYLIDSGFIQVDKSIIRELSRARFSRNRTRFVLIPSELDANSDKPTLVHAALAAGLYPKILSVDQKNGQLRTITNNQHAMFHPSSVNFGRNPIDFGVNHLTYFTLMHSKKLYAWETAPVDDLSMLLLCGEADFKLAADTIYIDRKIKVCTSPKTSIALKILRERLTSLLARQYEGKVLTDSQSKWMELGLLALSRIKLVSENDGAAIGIR